MENPASDFPVNNTRNKQNMKPVQAKIQQPTAPRLRLPEDRELLAFVFARFIDGEMTGLSEGHALNYAPDLASADFLAKQIRDEIRHARMYARLVAYTAPGSAVPRAGYLLQQIMAPLSGRVWAEHCFLDKAVGERWVLSLMETLIAHVDDKKIVTNLKAIARDERGHIAFGEQQTRAYAYSRWRRYYLWGLFLRVDFAMGLAYRLLRRMIQRRYSPAAAQLLKVFFTDARQGIAQHTADLLGVRLNRSFGQMLFCQLVFLLKSPFAGRFHRTPYP